MSGSDRPRRHASADASTPARFLLLEALQAVATNCRALEGIARGPRGSGGNLADFTRSDDWALSNLRDFWQAHDNAQRLLDELPFPPDALAQLNALARQKAGWKLATRATLDAIADAISETRPTFTADAAPEFQDAERRRMLTAWRTAAGDGLGGPPGDWLALLPKLQRLTAALNAIRSERYPAAGADRRGGAVDDLQAQHATADENHGQAGGAEDPKAAAPQDLAGVDEQAPAVAETPEEKAFRDLANWAAENLFGKQRRVVELLAENGGRIPIADLASDPAIDWKAPFDDSFHSLAKELNAKPGGNRKRTAKPKLCKIGWRVFRKDNEARLARILVGQK